MALIIPPGYAQTTIEWTGARFESGVGATTFGWGEALGPDPMSLDAFALAVRDAWVDNILPLQDGDLTLASIEVVGATDTAERTVGLNGGTNFASVPPNVACLVRKVVSGRGRRRQGRWFLPGILAAGVVNDAGIIDSGAVSSIQAAVFGFLTDLEAASNGTMVILQGEQRIENGAPVGTPPISPPPVVTNLFVEPKVASQRNRLRR